MSERWPRVRLGEVLVPVQRPEVPTPGTVYRQLGVRLWGEGAYEREPVDGAATKYATLSRVATDDVVVNKIWARNGSVAVVQPELDGCFVSGEFPTYQPQVTKLVPRWMHWLTKTADFWVQCDEKSRGTSGKNRIKPEQFLHVEIPLPPIAEQRRIVGRIEELAAKVEEARGLRRGAVEEGEALERSALAAAIPSDVPVEPLGNLIAADSSISYGVLVPGPDVEDGVPFVRVQDLRVKDPAPHPSKRISPSVEASYARTRLRGGEILVAVVGATIGKIGIVPPNWRGANIARAVCRIVPNDHVDRAYFVQVLMSHPVQDYFSTVTRTLAQPTLNVGQLAQTPIPLPSLSEQRQIAGWLAELQAKLHTLRSTQTQTGVELEALLPSILDKAFRNQLR